MTTTYTTRDTVIQRLRLAERDEDSPALGGTVRLRELTRQVYKDVARWASTTDLAQREHARGTVLVAAIQHALDAPDSAQTAERLRAAIGQYLIGAPENAVDANRWNAALLAAGWIDPESGKPLWTAEEIMAWPARDEVWAEVARLAQCVYDLSEAGQESLKSGDPAPHSE